MGVQLKGAFLLVARLAQANLRNARLKGGADLSGTNVGLISLCATWAVTDNLSRATMNRAAGDSHPDFTPRQGQYLAFIYAYTLVNERPPAQADIQRFFRLTPPSVYQMLLTLEREGLISRRAGVPRSIAVLVDRALLPALEPARVQPVKITMQRY